MAGTKSSNAEIEDAVNRICKLMIVGMTRTADIQDYIRQMDELPEKKQREANWNPIRKSRAVLSEYIQKAKEKFKESASRDRNEIKGVLAERLDDLYKRAVKEGKMQTANNILKNMMWLEAIGGMNMKTFNKIDFNQFDVKLPPEKQKEFEDRLAQSFGKDFIKESGNDK